MYSSFPYTTPRGVTQVSRELRKLDEELSTAIPMVTMITEKIATAHVSIKTNLRQEANGEQPQHQDNAEINIKYILKGKDYLHSSCTK